jgi:Serine kinase of the HPr protein, regulates carbohydrate metabolism
VATDGPLRLHATTIAWNGRAAVITGASGSGKSSLALQLMAWGAKLVTDDITLLHRAGDHLIATGPAAGRGLIEARGVGLLRAETRIAGRVALAVDLDRVETERLPPRRSVLWHGLTVPLILHQQSPHFAPAVLQCLKSGRHR